MKTILALLISGSLMITPAKAETVQCKKQGDVATIAIVVIVGFYITDYLLSKLVVWGQQKEIAKLKDQCGDKR